MLVFERKYARNSQDTAITAMSTPGILTMT